jgi:polar amino acid transport system substrate-binding protein
LTRRPALLLASLALLVAACGSSTLTGQRLPDAIGQPPFAASPVPAPSGLLNSGQLTVANVPSLPVQQYLDHQQKPAGFDIDLINALGSQLGLRVGFHVAGSEADVIPGLADQQRKYDMGMADQVETPALTTGIKTVEYFTTGQSILVRDADKRTATLDDLCGAKVGALRNSPGEAAVLTENEAGCTAKAIQYQAYDDGSKGVQDLVAGKLAAYVDEYTSAVYFNRVYAGMRLVPHPTAPAKEVMVFNVGDTALRDAIAAALDRLQKNGTYSGLLHKWGLDEGGL